MALEKRSKQVTFWMTVEEKHDLHDLAEALGLDVSKTIRLGLSRLREQS